MKRRAQRPARPDDDSQDFEKFACQRRSHCYNLIPAFIFCSWCIKMSYSKFVYPSSPVTRAAIYWLCSYWLLLGSLLLRDLYGQRSSAGFFSVVWLVFRIFSAIFSTIMYFSNKMNKQIIISVIIAACLSSRFFKAKPWIFFYFIFCAHFLQLKLI